MTTPPGLRERKKDATRALLMRTALDLFEQRGFDEVSVSEIAEAAEVSRKTIFNYFEVKEDLILGHGKHQIEAPAELVHARLVGQTPVTAFREQWFEALTQFHPITGLCDHPDVLRVLRLIHGTPQLMQRQQSYNYRSQELLAQALRMEGGTDLAARLIAAQIFAVRQELSVANFRGIAAGATAAEFYPRAAMAATEGFDLLEHGMGDLLRRTV